MRNIQKCALVTAAILGLAGGVALFWPFAITNEEESTIRATDQNLYQSWEVGGILVAAALFCVCCVGCCGQAERNVSVANNASNLHAERAAQEEKVSIKVEDPRAPLLANQVQQPPGGAALQHSYGSA